MIGGQSLKRKLSNDLYSNIGVNFCETVPLNQEFGQKINGFSK